MVNNDLSENFHISQLLTLIMLDRKVISLCHQYRARPACTSVQSDIQAGLVLYSLLTNFSPVIFLKLTMDNSKSGRWITAFKKCIKLRVNFVNLIYTGHLVCVLGWFNSDCKVYVSDSLHCNVHGKIFVSTPVQFYKIFVQGGCNLHRIQLYHLTAG